MGWIKSGDFQLNGDEAVQATVEKQQVDRAVARADLDGILLADEGEIAAQFPQKLPQTVDQGPPEVRLGVSGWQVQKFNDVAVFEVLAGLLG